MSDEHSVSIQQDRTCCLPPHEVLDTLSLFDERCSFFSPTTCPWNVNWVALPSASRFLLVASISSISEPRIFLKCLALHRVFRLSVDAAPILGLGYGVLCTKIARPAGLEPHATFWDHRMLIWPIRSGIQLHFATSSCLKGWKGKKWARLPKKKLALAAFGIRTKWSLQGTDGT